MILHLIRGSPTEAVCLVAVEPQHLDGAFDAEVVEHTAHLQTQQIILAEGKREKLFTKHI